MRIVWVRLLKLPPIPEATPSFGEFRYHRDSNLDLLRSINSVVLDEIRTQNPHIGKPRQRAIGE